MIYIEKKPFNILQKYIKCIWTIEYNGTLTPSENERILPDGYTEIIVNFSDRFKCKIDGGKENFLTNSFASGPFTKYLHLEATGKVGLLGIRFWPGMMYPFFQIPMKELTNKYIDLSFIAKELSKEIEASVLSSTNFEERFSLVNSILTKHLMSKLTPTNKVVEESINIIKYSNGMIAVASLSESIGIGSRQLERLFNVYLGISPKMFNRITRFQRIFKELEKHRINNWLVLALQCGYYDQAHFIKEFKQFSGMNPNSFFIGSNELTRYFTTNIRMSDLYNTSAQII
ncbi:helix-turn-helix domain-containing protein [Clostridium swellfunianum]|uniref:helix-turn-helix domain-containing protein n=1 Tax=Clostridium swellfunianum TaxID=1367462 RepID=UPI00202F9E17|nr:helix-turn-helix domain-containing protein [Clostridium swellfunianum]MCM0649103.1 helix-turn-helix domain-containing protein [Clostridium swellfunianum]